MNSQGSSATHSLGCVFRGQQWRAGEAQSLCAIKLRKFAKTDESLKYHMAVAQNQPESLLDLPTLRSRAKKDPPKFLATRIQLLECLTCQILSKSGIDCGMHHRHL